MSNFKKIVFIFAIFFLFDHDFFSVPSAEAFPVGDGSTNNPYHITTCSELHAIGGNPGSSFVISNNIDCSGFGNFAPINSFSGTLDGQDFMVSGVSIVNDSSPGSVGLFGNVNSNALIKNLRFKNFTLTNNKNSSAYIGALAGLIEDSTVQHVSFINLTVNGNNAGGVGNYLGGVFGIASNANISEIEITGTSTVIGTTYVGGMVGILDNSFADDNAQLINCFSNATVSATNYAGGLIGVLEGPLDPGPTGSVKKSFVTGNVTGSALVGAFIGVAGGPSSIPIENNFATGTASGGSFFGSGGFSDYSTDYYTGASCSGGCHTNIDASTWYNSISSPPLDQWDFSSVWVKQAGALPKLRFDPVISEYTAIPTPTNDITPSYTFSSTRAGTITYGGSCSSATTNALLGNSLVVFNALVDGVYNNCTVKVTDDNGYASNIFGISNFTIDTTAPTVEVVPAITISTPTILTSIPFTASFNEAVNGFAVDDISVTNGTLNNFTTITPHLQFGFNIIPSSTGMVGVSIDGGKAQDLAVNDNVASSSYNFLYTPAQPGGSDISSVTETFILNPVTSSPTPTIVDLNSNTVVNNEINTQKNLKNLGAITADKTDEPFIDMIGHWGHDFAKQLFQLKIIEGRSPKKFFPEGILTMAEALKIGLLTYGYRLDANDYPLPIKGLDMNAWYIPYLKKASKEGFIIPINIKLDANITRKDALVLLLNMAKKKGQGKAAPFLDVDQKDSWAPLINYAYTQGVIQGKAPWIFDPFGTITRAEIAKIALKIRSL